MLLPETRDLKRYEAEPFVLPADVCAAPGHEGTAGWTWYTGSAGWYFRAVCEGLLGLRLLDGKLHVSPAAALRGDTAIRWTDAKGRKWLLYGFPFPHHRIPDSYEAWRDTNTWEKVDWSGREKVAKMADGSRIEACRLSRAAR